MFGTPYIPDAPQTVDRVIDISPPREQHLVRAYLANTVQSISTQTPIPRRDGRGRVVACARCSSRPSE
jgi:twitching motility protein PilT